MDFFFFFFGCAASASAAFRALLASFRAFFAAASFSRAALTEKEAAPGPDRAPDPRKWAPAARSAARAGGRRRPPKPWSPRRPGGSAAAGRGACVVYKSSTACGRVGTRVDGRRKAILEFPRAPPFERAPARQTLHDKKGPSADVGRRARTRPPSRRRRGAPGRRGRPPPWAKARRTASSLGPCLKWCCRARGGRGARRYFCFTCFAGPAGNGALGSALRCAVE